MDAVVSKSNLLKLSEMESIAKEATYEALRAYVPISDEDKNALVLGKVLTDEAGVFELYVPGDKAQNAKVVSRASVDRATGQVTVEVFLPSL
ncbi:hypothetical protein GIY62_17315 [Burkholderia plantarii]|uniref:hypothetical protein n=1 Tax=Burkholderia plantarii TaxID=41899 RepID=UPI00272B0195|nr:hypothetical protein [Burkholderia plantarii]WLE58845.1 hypothetical protein GIY62_17315 [Burkholderia plantarii]